MPALNERFEHQALPLFAKHGIRPVGFWTCYIGPSANTLRYMLAWDDLAERERIWNGFASDPEWLAMPCGDGEGRPAHRARREHDPDADAYSKLR